MANEKNLKLFQPYEKLTPDERKKQTELTRAAQKKSVEARNKNKTIKEVAQMVLKLPVDLEVAKKYCGDYISGDVEKDLTLETLASISLMREVVENGNAKAYEVLRDTAGFSPKVDLNINGNLDVLTASDRAILTKMREKLPSIVQSADSSETE